MRGQVVAALSTAGLVTAGIGTWSFVDGGAWWFSPAIGMIAGFLQLAVTDRGGGEAVDPASDGLDEWGGFSPHEFMLGADEVYREIDAARALAQRQAVLDAEWKAERDAQRLADEQQREWQRAEFDKTVAGWVKTLDGYRTELAERCAEAADDELPSREIYRRFVAARVDAYEQAIEQCTFERAWLLAESQRRFGGHPQDVSLMATRLKDQFLDHLTGPLYREWTAALDVEKQAARQVKLDELVEAMSKARRDAGRGEVFEVVNGCGEVVQHVATGRARLQAEVDARDLADNGRLDRSVS